VREALRHECGRGHGHARSAAIEAGRPLVEAFHYRFHPAFIHALGHIRSGHVGKILSMEAAFSVPIPYRPGELRHTLETGGGALMDLGTYCIHMVRTMAGRRAVGGLRGMPLRPAGGRHLDPCAAGVPRAM
jgi:predicted dehydrogenase